MKKILCTDIIYPMENLGVVVMANDSTIDRDALADVLANMDW